MLSLVNDGRAFGTLSDSEIEAANPMRSVCLECYRVAERYKTRYTSPVESQWVTKTLGG